MLLHLLLVIFNEHVDGFVVVLTDVMMCKISVYVHALCQRRCCSNQTVLKFKSVLFYVVTNNVSLRQYDKLNYVCDGQYTLQETQMI